VQPYKPGEYPGYDYEKYKDYRGQKVDWSINIFSCKPEFRKMMLASDNIIAEFIPESVFLDDRSIIR
jgi:hypothetical protein